MQLDQQMSDRTAAEEELKKVKRELEESTRAHELEVNLLQERLEAAQTGVSQSKMLDLELAELERNVDVYKNLLDDKEAVLAEKVNELATMTESCRSLETQLQEAQSQRAASEERVGKLKQMLVKSKKELAEVQKSMQETEERSRDSIRERDCLTSEIDDLKLQLSSALALKVSTDQELTNTKNRFQARLQATEEKLNSARAKLEQAEQARQTLAEDFDAYKTKVSAAWRAEKRQPIAAKTSAAANVSTKSATGGESDAADSELLRQRLEQAVASLKEQLAASQAATADAQDERDAVARELDAQRRRGETREAEAAAREARLQARLDQLAEAEARAGERARLEMQSREQAWSQLEAGLRERIAELESRVDSLEEANHELQCAADKANAAAAAAKEKIQQQQQQQKQTHPPQTPPPPAPPPPPPKERRPAAEGSEATTSVSAASATSAATSSPSGSSIVPLEQLLLMQQQKLQQDGNSGGGGGATADFESVDAMRLALIKANRRIEHLTSLLSESEEMSVRLAEQARVLKEEIRRQAQRGAQ
ncbi:hypothetical protein BOX15_Mlig023045g2 [Macrostomum lignano]|uniref:Uncharacterized protein n=1 Tax=Macrostomum lignano TaxID=282301 RepID=A0A267FIJ8_9PLAT|nr:hypothetical protein BOX15_Mlig023045g2 [Macrostomum lignano]